MLPPRLWFSVTSVVYRTYATWTLLHDDTVEQMKRYWGIIYFILIYAFHRVNGDQLIIFGAQHLRSDLLYCSIYLYVIIMKPKCVDHLVGDFLETDGCYYKIILALRALPVVGRHLTLVVMDRRPVISSPLGRMNRFRTLIPGVPERF